MVDTTMITPRLTAVMMAVTALIGAGPVAAFAQAANVQEIGDLTNAAVIETGRNSQVNAAETTQVADNSIEIENEAESGDAEAEGGDAESEADAEAESGDAKGKYSESEAEAEAESEAEGGDAEAESGDATAVQILDDVTFDNDVTQTSATVQTNDLDDADAVVVTQTNVPVQTQETPIAVDLDIVLEEVLGEIPEL